MASKTTASNKAVAPAASKAIVVPGMEDMPDHIRNLEGGSGLKGLDQSDFVVPRIILLQATSKQVEAHEAAKVGNFWLGVMDVNLGPTIDFIPCNNRKRYLLLAPMEDGKGILARADDGVTWNPPSGEWSVKIKGQKQPVTWKITDANVKKSGLTEYGTQIPGDPESKPAATLFYDFLVYLPDYPQYSPCLLSLARTQAKKGKDLQGKIELRRKPMVSQRFRMSIVDDRDKEGHEFKNVAFAYSGWANPEELKLCQDIASRFTDYKAADQEEFETGAGEQDAAAPKDRGNL